MPPSLWKWANSLPEDQLAVKKAQLEFHNMNYSLGAKYILDGWQGHLVKTDLTPRIDEIAPILWDELSFAVDRRLGTTPGEWVEVDATDFVTDIITRAMSRFIVNLPLCRDEEYLAAARAGSDAFILAGAANAVVSPLLRPISGFFTRIYSGRVLNRLKKAWEPVYRERMERFAKGDNTDEPLCVPPPPPPKFPPYLVPANTLSDYLQAILQFGHAHRPSDIHSLDDTSRRLTLVNFSAMHTTTITTLNLLLDLIGSDPSHQTLSQLHDEATRILGAQPSAQSFTRAAVARLVKADSAARETMRLRSFGAHVNFRRVQPPGGLTVTTPDDGFRTVIPQGMMLSWGSMAVARDADVYEDSYSYDPFRFWRMREAVSATKDGREALSAFVATSLTHMPFGHGKHACPGRFLIDVELKMVVAYLVVHYDLAFPEEYGGRRPENRWLAEGEMPPVGVRIRARRR